MILRLEFVNSLPRERPTSYDWVRSAPQMLKDPSFFDHFKIRSDNTKHTLINNKDLTPDFGGKFEPAKGGQGHWFFQVLR
jgi:hypothetical protein